MVLASSRLTESARPQEAAALKKEKAAEKARKKLENDAKVCWLDCLTAGMPNL